MSTHHNPFLQGAKQMDLYAILGVTAVIAAMERPHRSEAEAIRNGELSDAVRPDGRRYSEETAWQLADEAGDREREAR